MTQIVRAQAGDLRNPSQSVEHVLDKLALHAPEFADLVREHLLSAS